MNKPVFRPAVLGNANGKRPWFASSLVGQEWSWLVDSRNRCRKFATKEAAQAACDLANKYQGNQ